MPNKKMYTGLDMDSNKVTGLPAPTETSDAATKAYVDANAGGTVNSVNGQTPTAGAVTVTATDIAISDALGNFPTDTVQGAIDSLFTFANDGKTTVANAIGSPATSTNTFAELATHITNLKNKTYGVSKQVKFDETIAADDIIKSYYTAVDYDALTGFDTPTTTGLAAAWSNTGYLAIGSSGSPYYHLYKNTGDSFTKIETPFTNTNLVTNANGQTNGMAFSKDGTYFAGANNAGIYLHMYKKVAGLDAYNKLAVVGGAPAGNARSVAFDPDTLMLAVGHANSPFVSIYNRTPFTDTFTKITPTFDTPLPGQVNGIAFSNSGNYLACAHASGNFLSVYKRNGTTFNIQTIAVSPNGTGNAVAFSDDDSYLAVAHAISPFVTIYKRDGDTFTKQADAVVLPSNTGLSVSWSHDNAYLAVGHAGVTGNFKYISVYKIGNPFTKQDDVDPFPTGNSNGIAYNPDSKYLAVANTTTPFMRIYKNAASDTKLFIKVSPAGTEAVDGKNTSYGIAKESGTAGQTKLADILLGG